MEFLQIWFTKNNSSLNACYQSLLSVYKRAGSQGSLGNKFAACFRISSLSEVTWKYRRFNLGCGDTLVVGMIWLYADKMEKMSWFAIKEAFWKGEPWTTLTSCHCAMVVVGLTTCGASSLCHPAWGILIFLLTPYWLGTRGCVALYIIFWREKYFFSRVLKHPELEVTHRDHHSTTTFH